VWHYLKGLFSAKNIFVPLHAKFIKNKTILGIVNAIEAKE